MAKASKKKKVTLAIAVVCFIVLYIFKLRYFGKLVTYDNVHISYIDWMGVRHGLGSVGALAQFSGKTPIKISAEKYNSFKSGELIP